MQNALAIWVKLDTTGSLQIKSFFLQTQPTNVQSGAEIGLGFHAASAEDCANLLPAAAYQRKNVFFIPLCCLYSSAKRRNQGSNPFHVNYSMSDKALYNIQCYMLYIVSVYFLPVSWFAPLLLSRLYEMLSWTSEICCLSYPSPIFHITHQDADISGISMFAK